MTHGSTDTSRKQILKLVFSLLFSIAALNSYGQAPADFSGTWVQDIDKSDDFYKNFDVKCSITQTPSIFTIKTTFSDKDGKELVTRESSFNLDGKEVISEEGRAKMSAVWSADKKSLTTSDTKVYGAETVGVRTTYSLSADGRLLTVKTADINPAVAPIKQVFSKK